jgi:threonine dehydrogenase-like Zn-dependent dehydrogenase
VEHAFGNAPVLWRHPAPRPRYDIVVVGGGLHGLSTAYHLAREHGATSVAVVRSYTRIEWAVHGVDSQENVGRSAEASQYICFTGSTPNQL